MTTSVYIYVCGCVRLSLEVKMSDWEITCWWIKLSRRWGMSDGFGD